MVTLNQLSLVGDAGRRLYTTMERSALIQKNVQGWKFSSLFLRLCWFHIPVTAGIIASILIVASDQTVSTVARTLIQAIRKSLDVLALYPFFISFLDLVPLTLWLAFGTNPVPISTFCSTKLSLTLWIGSLSSRWNLHQVAHMASKCIWNDIKKGTPTRLGLTSSSVVIFQTHLLMGCSL